MAFLARAKHLTSSGRWTRGSEGKATRRTDVWWLLPLGLKSDHCPKQVDPKFFWLSIRRLAAQQSQALSKSKLKSRFAGVDFALSGPVSCKRGSLAKVSAMLFTRGNFDLGGNFAFAATWLWNTKSRRACIFRYCFSPLWRIYAEPVCREPRAACFCTSGDTGRMSHIMLVVVTHPNFHRPACCVPTDP